MKASTTFLALSASAVFSANYGSNEDTYGLAMPQAWHSQAPLSSLNSHLLSAAAPTASFCAPTGDFCVSVYPDSGSRNLTFVVTSTAQGWVSVAMGPSMLSSTMFVGWTCRSFSVISQRNASSYSLPRPMEPTFTNTSIPASFKLLPNTRTAYAFTIPASAPYIMSDFIYASSDAPPSDLENPNSSFGYHQQKGYFKLDLKGSPGDNPAGEKVVNIPATSSTSISTFCRDASNSFCLVSIRNEVASTVTFVAYSSLTGWVGFGTGQVMAGSRMFIGWINGEQAVISQRTTSEYNLPTPVNATIFTAVPLPAGINLPSSIEISFAFTVPISSGIASTTSPTEFMFAGSNSAPGNPSVPSSSFRKHEFRGQFSVDVSKLGQSSGEGAGSTPAVDLLLLHGIFMFLGWCVLPPIAIFVARYLKFRLGHAWYLTHTGIMLFGVSACIATALVCVEVNLTPGKPRFITTPHGILGATLCFAIYPMQVAFGFISNGLFNSDRECVPWWDRMHWWTGRVAVLLAVVNVQLGLTLFEASSLVVALFWVFIVLVVGGVGGFVGEYWLNGAVHHVKTGILNESGPAVHNRLLDDHVEGDEQGTASHPGHSGSDLPSGEQRV